MDVERNAEEVFDDDYLYFWGDLLDEESDGDADLIWKALALGEGMEVLDVPCGQGRIANRLAARGVRVTGLDVSQRFLGFASQDAVERGVDVTYVQGDMRSLPWTEKFDGIVNWFNSFGFFNDEENRQVLCEAHRALRPGGKLLMSMEHQAWVLRELSNQVFERNDDLQINQNTYEPLEGRLYTTTIVIRNGQSRSRRDFIRLLGFPELRDWLLAAGFSRVDGYGREGGQLLYSSDQMLVVATR